MDIIEKISNHFQLGCALKDEARKSVNKLDVYLEASQHFRKAAELHNEILSTSNLAIDNQIQSEVFSNYYLSEHHSCLYSYYYEHRETETAKMHQEKVISFFEKAIKLITENADKCSEETKNKLNSFLPKWRWMVKNDKIQLYAPDARKYWDSDRPIEALDLYRKMSELNLELIEYAKESNVDPVYERIAIGNYIGMIANESSALAKIFFGKSKGDYPKKLSIDDGLELIKHTFKAAQYARLAYNKNPEWEQYIEGARIAEENIVILLNDNHDLWLPVYLNFEENKEMLNFMKNINLEKFKEVEAKRHFTENKIGKLWSVGSFWLIVFLIVIGVWFLLFSSSFSFWQIILMLLSSEVILLIIGGLSLRTMGDLSEDNFLKLIRLTFINQLNHIKIFSRNIDSKV